MMLVEAVVAVEAVVLVAVLVLPVGLHQLPAQVELVLVVLRAALAVLTFSVLEELLGADEGDISRQGGFA